MSKIKLTKTTACLIALGVGFVSGILTGIVSTKDKYEKQADYEIESIRKVYLNRMKKYNREEKPENDISDDQEKITTLDLKAYQKEVSEIARSHKYTNPESDDISDEEDETSEPYAISRELFDTKGYDVVFLTYYADEILADDSGHIMSIASEDGYDSLTMPADVLEHIVDDVAYCRDDNLQIDYEITCDPRPYSDVFEQDGVLYEDDD